MLRLALRTLRFRLGGFTASFIALFFGALIVSACGGLMETGIRADLPPERLAAAPLVVAGDRSYQVPKSGDPERVDLPAPKRLSSDVVTAVRAVPGVAKAVPDVSFPVAVLRPGDRTPIEVDRRPAGHGWSSASLAPYALTAGRAPRASGEVVLDASLAHRAGIAPGTAADLVVDGSSRRFQVTGIVAGDSLPGGVFFTDSEAGRMTDGRVDAVAVFPSPGTATTDLGDRIKESVDGVTVLSGDDRGRAEFVEAFADGEILIVMSAVFGGCAVMVMVFVVASTLGLSIQQRQREMALLRTIGTTPGQLRRMVLAEAVAVTALAIALAYPFGAMAGRALFDQITAHQVVASEIVFQQGWVPAAAAAGVGLLTCVAAALIAARRAATTRPAEFATEVSVQNVRLGWARILFGTLSLAGATALAVVTATVMSGPVAASTATPAAMLWASGLALLGPRIAPVVTALMRPALRAVSGTAGHVALLNLRARRTRTAAAIAPVMLATGLATGMIYLQTSQSAEARQEFSESLRADAAIAPAAGGVSPELVDAVRRTPGVAAASTLVTSIGYLEQPRFPAQSDEGLPLLGVDPDGIDAVTAVSVTGGSLTDLRGNAVALNSRLAERIGHAGGHPRVGDVVTLRLADGTPAQLKVVALFTTSDGPDSALLPASLLAQHIPADAPTQVLVRAAPGTDRAALRAALGAVTEGRPDLRVADRSTVTAAFAEQERTGAWINYMFVAVIVGYAVISLINTLVVSASQRRREFALQRLIGSTRGQLLRMMTVEATAIAVTGILLGGLVAILTLIPFGIALNGSPLPSGPAGVAITVVAAAAGLTLVATLLPSWLALLPRATKTAADPEG